MLFSRALIPTMKEAPPTRPTRATCSSRAPGTSAGSAPASTTSCRSASACSARSRRIVREEMDRAGALEILMPALLPGRVLQGDGPLGPLRRRALSPQGPQGRRLPPRPDARGDRHRHRAARDPELPRSAEEPLPGAGEVPRRAAAARRAAARPRVPHEGRLLVRRRRGRARRELRDDARRPTCASSTAWG